MRTQTLENIKETAKIKGRFSIIQVKSFTEECFSKVTMMDDEDLYSPSPSFDDALKLALEVTSSETKTDGTASDYHNYAVLLASEDEYFLSCEVLKRGLEHYPKNKDLLADYLLYAIKSCDAEHYEKCESVYETLQTLRPQLWDWRAYDFTIDYLLDKIDRGLGGPPLEVFEECLKLVHEFQKHFPTNEWAYLDEANIYRIMNECEKERNVLEKAMAKDNLQCTRVASRLLKIYLDNNLPKKAEECAQRIQKDYGGMWLSISPVQMYTLIVISSAALFMSTMQINKKNEREYDSELSARILRDWETVKRLPNKKDNDFYETAETLVKLVKAITDISHDNEI